jgi:excinuclease ABC subunit C
MIRSDSLQNGVDVLKKHIQTLPEKPGVYRMIDEHGTVLYVGKAKNLIRRVKSYTLVERLPVRLQRMVSLIRNLEIVITATEVEALLLENNLIKKFKPHYNILLKDDKSYPYIYFTEHTFPRIIKYRGPKDKKGHYFGPFADIAAVEEAILSIQRLFYIRNCSDSFFKLRKRPCLQYFIKRCSAPCVGKILPPEYGESVNEAMSFLKGKTDFVQQKLSAHMLEASANLDYEKAAQYRDRLKLLTKIQHEQHVDIGNLKEIDVVAIYKENNHSVVQIFFYRNGRNFGTQSIFLENVRGENEKTCMDVFLKQFYINHPAPEHILLNIEPENVIEVKLLIEAHHQRLVFCEVPIKGVKRQLVEDALNNAKQALARKLHTELNMKKILVRLKDIFSLPDIPNRIEAYDNSHIQGSHPVGVMIVAHQDGFDKKSYRKFSIQHQRGFGGDDFAMMEEVLKRRFQHLEDWGRPDMLLIDGGAGQITRAKNVCQELGLTIPIIGIAKGKDRNAGREHFLVEGKEPFQLEHNDPLLFFLQRIRDESHRFAITMHRHKRIKAIKKSMLDDIPDIGPSRKKALLKHFGSVYGVRDASIRELENVQGIHKQTAEKIYNYFHES